VNRVLIVYPPPLYIAHISSLPCSLLKDIGLFVETFRTPFLCGFLPTPFLREDRDKKESTSSKFPPFHRVVAPDKSSLKNGNALVPATLYRTGHSFLSSLVSHKLLTRPLLRISSRLSGGGSRFPLDNRVSLRLFFPPLSDPRPIYRRLLTESHLSLPLSSFLIPLDIGRGQVGSVGRRVQFPSYLLNRSVSIPPFPHLNLEAACPGLFWP